MSIVISARQDLHIARDGAIVSDMYRLNVTAVPDDARTPNVGMWPDCQEWIWRSSPHKMVPGATDSVVQSHLSARSHLPTTDYHAPSRNRSISVPTSRRRPDSQGAGSPQHVPPERGHSRSHCADRRLLGVWQGICRSENAHDRGGPHLDKNLLAFGPCRHLSYKLSLWAFLP